MQYNALDLLGERLLTAVPPSASVVLDNAKFGMMVLVILTQSLTPNLPSYLRVLSLINPFQTRTFAFISGFVSKKSANWYEAMHASRNTLLQILLFALFIEPIYALAAGQVWTLSGYLWEVYQMLVFPGQNVQWYLYGLVYWRCQANQMVLGTPWRTRLLQALVISAIGRVSYLKFLSLGEVLGSWPFFVAGQICREEWSTWEELFSERMEESRMWKSGFLSFRPLQWTIAMMVFLYLHGLTCSLGGLRRCPTLSSSPWTIQDLYHHDHTGWFLKTLLLMLGDVFMLLQVLIFLLFLCPRKEQGFTAMGRRTLFPYLLHHPFMPLFTRLTTETFKGLGGAAAWTGLLCSSILTVLVLASEICGRIVGPIVQPFTRD